MKKSEAIKIVKREIGAKADDKRTKVHKAVTVLENMVEIDEEALERIIDETIKEFESHDN